jgi:hydrogenase 3 maturation protease
MNEKTGIERICDARWRKVAVVGIGNEMRGDDAVGCYVARKLEGISGALVIDAGDVPENYTQLLRAYEPDCILLIDAVDVGANAGSIVIMHREELPLSLSVSTHGIPLRLLADYLHRELGADVMLIGIQVGTTSFGATMCDDVKESADVVAEFLTAYLSSTGCSDK